MGRYMTNVGRDTLRFSWGRFRMRYEQEVFIEGRDGGHWRKAKAYWVDDAGKLIRGISLDIDRERAKNDPFPYSTDQHLRDCDVLFGFFKCACKQAKEAGAMRPDFVDLVNALAKQLNPALTGKYNETILHIAAKYGQREAMDILVDRGADVHAKTSIRKRTPLDYLRIYEKDPESAKYYAEKAAVRSPKGETLSDKLLKAESKQKALVAKSIKGRAKS